MYYYYICQKKIALLLYVGLGSHNKPAGQSWSGLGGLEVGVGWSCFYSWAWNM